MGGLTSGLTMMENRENNGTKNSGGGIEKPISFIPLLYWSAPLSKHELPIEYNVYIWQVSPQLSCGDPRQIWKWLKEPNISLTLNVRGPSYLG